MVPEDNVPEDDAVVVAVVSVADLRRLHTLLCCYESPFVTSAEVEARRADLRALEGLRVYVRGLLDELPMKDAMRRF